MADITKHYINLTPTSGYETTSLILKADPENPNNRKNLRAHFTIKPSDKNVTISSQKLTATILGVGEFVKSEESEIEVSVYGDTVTVKGISNSKKLCFSLGDTVSDEGESVNSLIVTDLESATYKVYGETIDPLEVVNNYEIADDPGASHEYNFVIVLEAGPNEYHSGRHQDLIITGKDGEEAVITISQTAIEQDYLFFNGDPSCVVEDLALSYMGEEATVQLTTNANFEIY